MKNISFLLIALFILSATACVSKKKLTSVQSELEMTKNDLSKCGQDLGRCVNELRGCEQELNTIKSSINIREEQISDLKSQIEDYRNFSSKQVEQVGDLTVLSQSANENIKETLDQLREKDEYIKLVQAAKTKADSINLALAINLKGVLQDGIADQDIEIKVDKTVVFINLSDKMLYQSGSAMLTERANEVLGKIAKIVDSRPDMEVMVEGYTDNVPIKTSCMNDNWDLSVKRATSVVRTLQNKFNIDPDRLIAAGRGEYNKLASNDTADGRSINRRTRIIILPKLNQFYDLLNPNQVPE